MLEFKHPKYWNVYVMHVNNFILCLILWDEKYCDLLKSVLLESRIVITLVIGLLYGFCTGQRYGCLVT